MLSLSEVLIQEHELVSFDELKKVISNRAAGEMFFSMDVKPPFSDTPENWEEQLSFDV